FGRSRRRRGLGRLVVERLDRGVIGQLHGPLLLFVYATIWPRKKASYGFACGIPSLLAVLVSRATASSPRSSPACCCACSQAGTARSSSLLPWAVRRNGCVRASSPGTTSSQPLARIRSTLRLSVDVSRCR